MAREKKATKVFINDDGTESRSAKPGWSALEFRFENGNTLSVKPADFNESIMVCAGGYGLSQKIGDAYSSAESIDDAQEKAEAMIEQLTQGIWVSEREATGPRIGVLVEAVARVLEANDRPADRVALAEKYKGDHAAQKAAKANPQVALMYEEVQAEKAKERVKALKAKAKEADLDLDSLAA